MSAQSEYLRYHLAPCAHCGGADISVRIRKTTIVECIGCGSMMFDWQNGIQRDVVAAWNRRPAPLPKQDEVTA